MVQKISVPPSPYVSSTQKKAVPTLTLKSKIDTHPVAIPNLYFFEQLKSEEQKWNHKKRIRTHYQNNRTAALALPFSIEELEKNQSDLNQLITMSKSQIIEHANRRVDLFFYTLTAYYKTDVFPTTGHTCMQHGRGRNAQDSHLITEACHSSLIPALLDKTIYQDSKREDKKKSLLSGTHFMDSLNATVELPSCVNQFDGVLENSCRKKCIDLIDAAALGTINPVEGLDIFLKMMKDILNELKQQTEQHSASSLVRYSFMKTHHMTPMLIDLVIQGTLSTTFSMQTQSTSDEYIQLLLRLRPEEKKICMQEGKNKEKIYSEKIMELQSEILQTKSSRNNTTF